MVTANKWAFHQSTSSHFDISGFSIALIAGACTSRGRISRSTFYIIC